MKPWLLLTVIFLAACKEISFKEPQPRGKRNLKTIPAELQGKYLFRGSADNKDDTLTIFDTGYQGGGKAEDIAYLSDSLVLRHYRGYYYFSLNNNPEWLLRVVRRDHNGDLEFLALEPDQGSFGDFLDRLSAQVEVDSAMVRGEKLYRIYPSPRQLNGLIKKGLFKKTILKRVR